MAEETKVTIKIWALILVIGAILSWLSLTVFANTGRIVQLETNIKHINETSAEIKLFVKEISLDLKGHILDTNVKRKGSNGS